MIKTHGKKQFKGKKTYSSLWFEGTQSAVVRKRCEQAAVRRRECEARTPSSPPHRNWKQRYGGGAGRERWSQTMNLRALSPSDQLPPAKPYFPREHSPQQQYHHLETKRASPQPCGNMPHLMITDTIVLCLSSPLTSQTLSCHSLCAS